MTEEDLHLEPVTSEEGMQVFLHLKDVKSGLFSTLDWFILNDRVLFVRMWGIGKKESSRKLLIEKYRRILGEQEATEFLTRLEKLRRDLLAKVSVEDIQRILKVDPRNSQLLYSDIKRMKIKVTFFLGSQILILAQGREKKANVSWRLTSTQKLKLFFRARIGSRLFEK